jgi:diguanylate cyclase (GGDEF)-like protein/PAS domain S-box-containing protein
MPAAVATAGTALEALEVEHQALLSFLYLCPAGVVQTSLDGTVRMINPYAAQLLMPLAIQPSFITNLFGALERFAPELRNLAEAFVPERGQICQGHRIVIGGTGPGPRVLSCSLLKIGPDGLVALLQDISTEVEQERQLKQNEALFAALFVGVNDFALFSLDAEGRINAWNASGLRQTGFDGAAVRGCSLDILCDPEGARPGGGAEQIAAATLEGWSLRETRCLRRNGSRYWSQILVAAVEGEGDVIDGFSVVMRDVTERHITGDDLRRMLTTDQLTGAANRAHFFERAELEFSRRARIHRPLSAIMLDVDHFKRVNDNFGHAVGDDLLRALVRCCRACLREDDMLARLGGEEFAVLLPDADIAGALRVAELMRAAVAASLATLNDLPVGATISLGCAEASTEGIDGIDPLLRAADEALYRAKRAGRNQVMLASPVSRAVAAA